jgi:hypothetical protein
MRNVRATTSALLARLPKLNYLVVSLVSGRGSTAGFDPTDEGLDKNVAVMYYARWRFILDVSRPFCLGKAV